MASRMVEYIIGLKDQFSAAAAKVAAEAKKAEKSMQDLGRGVNTAESGINRAAGSVNNLANSLGKISSNAASAQRAIHGVNDAAALQAQRLKAVQERQALMARAEAENTRRQAEAARRTQTVAAVPHGSVRMGVAAGVAGAVSAAGVGIVDNLNPLGGQKTSDEILRTIQYVGEATSKQRQEIRNEVDNIASRIGVPQLDLLQGLQSLMQAGAKWQDLMGKGSNGRSVLENIGLAAKGSGESINDIAATLLPVIQQSGIAAEHGMRKAYEEVINTMAVAPQLSPDTTKGHIMGLRQTLGLLLMSRGRDENGKRQDTVDRLYEASAFQNTLSTLGYANAEAGTALRTLILRMMNPTKKGFEELKHAGVELDKITGVDPNKLANPDGVFASLPSRLGLDKKGFYDGLRKKAEESLAAGGSYFDLKDVYTEAAMSALPKKSSKDDKDAVKGAIARHFRGSGFDPRAFLEQITKLTAEQFFAIAGTYRTPQAAALAGPGAAGLYDKNLDDVKRRGPQALGQIQDIKLEGYAYAIDRLDASWTKFKNSLADSGALSAVTAAIDTASAAVNGLGKAFEMVAGRHKSTMDELAERDRREGNGGFGVLDPAANWMRRQMGWEQRPLGESGAAFTPEGYQGWLSRHLLTSAPQTANPLGFGAGLAGAKAEQNINVTTKLDPIQVTAPASITVNVTGTVNGAVQGSGQVPISATAPRGQTSATTVPGPAVAN